MAETRAGKGCTGPKGRDPGICNHRGQMTLGAWEHTGIYIALGRSHGQLGHIRLLYPLDCLPSKMPFFKGTSSPPPVFACNHEQLHETHVKSKKNYLQRLLALKVHANVSKAPSSHARTTRLQG